MNQILSVEMPKNNAYGKQKGEPKKASTKSILIFFAILLVIFGIAMIIVAISTKNNNNNSNKDNGTTPPVQVNSSTTRIDASQNGSEVDVDVSAASAIASIEYRWNEEATQQITTNGSTRMSFEIEDIPSGSNNLTIIAKDINGETATLTRTYVGAEKLNVELENAEINKLKITCKEEKIIKSLSYGYDSEELKTDTINNTTAVVEILKKQGEHTLTVKAIYEDESTKQISKKVYFPVVEKIEVPADGSSALIRASDERKIVKVTMNFNGQDLEEESPNSTEFQKTLQSINGENRLILTVYNSDGVTTTTRTRWIKTN